MLGKKALNTISLQYTGEEVYSPFKLKGIGAAVNTKRVRDAIETCPELTGFFERFDPRDRKNLTKYIEYIEFDKEVIKCLFNCSNSISNVSYMMERRPMK